jgi:hypothetical protein
MNFANDMSRRAWLRSAAARAATASLACVGVACAQTTPAPAPTAVPTPTASNRQDGPRLRLIGHTTLPHKRVFQGTTVGGLSGLDYDRERGVYYAISDDRSDINPARFYTLKLPITPDSVGPPELLRVTTLQAPNGKPYPNRRSVSADSPEVPDPESIRLRTATNTLYWTSEGDARRGHAPFIREMRLDGSYASQVPVPAMLGFDATGKTGVRDNKGFEGLSFTPSGDTLWVAMEAALIQDGPPGRAGWAGAAYAVCHPQRAAVSPDSLCARCHSFCAQCVGPIATRGPGTCGPDGQRRERDLDGLRNRHAGARACLGLRRGQFAAFVLD